MLYFGLLSEIQINCMGASIDVSRVLACDLVAKADGRT